MDCGAKGGHAAGNVVKSIDIDVGGCPLAGCISVGLHGGRPNGTLGLGPALATPSLTVTEHDPSEPDGCVQSNKLFGYVQAGPVFLQGNKTSKQISGVNYGPYKGSLSYGPMGPPAKFNPVEGDKGSSGFSAGAGFVHQWSCTA